MDKNENSNQLTDNFFRNEYGKIVSVVTKYLGLNSVEQAEDIVQEALLKATEHWRHNGVPENPQAWLYTTAKNLTYNLIKRNKIQQRYLAEHNEHDHELIEISFSKEIISDEQLKIMFTCCHPSISENSQIALILKILCGFSITEISKAFFTTNDTINKRLVRGRKQLREANLMLDVQNHTNDQVEIVLKTIYLLFNEGYNPTQKNELVRIDLCVEAIRLVNMLIDSNLIKDNSDCFALLALMQLNAARFEARIIGTNDVIEMELQDRGKWNHQLINQGVHHLNLATEHDQVSKYLILAAISANHCVAKKYQDTDWSEILSLYNTLLTIEDSPTIRLNRAVALSKIKGTEVAIEELFSLSKKSDIGNHYLFHATLASFYKQSNKQDKEIEHLKIAISLTENQRDIKVLEKKMNKTVPKV